VGRMEYTPGWTESRVQHLLQGTTTIDTIVDKVMLSSGTNHAAAWRAGLAVFLVFIPLIFMGIFIEKPFSREQASIVTRYSTLAGSKPQSSVEKRYIVAVLQRRQGIDLDGPVLTSGPSTDVYISCRPSALCSNPNKSSRADTLIMSGPGASFHLLGSQANYMSACQRGNYDLKYISTRRLGSHDGFCVRTNEGRLAWSTVSKPSKVEFVSLTVTAWDADYRQPLGGPQ
jgi:hypothetical protein